MVFKKKEENGGVSDQNIYLAGRKPREGKLSNRQLKERELLMLLRKMRPHVTDAIMESVGIMKNKEAADQNKLKAAVIILDNYRKLTLDLYDTDEPDEEGTEIQQQNQATFSLRMIDGTAPKEG